ncbi:MAG: hypothetical protein NT051_04820 [Candidatus Micrarchaeota archaeon]|nr:hypothetical protein [Candidatus Micrarchaeota archaeon]
MQTTDPNSTQGRQLVDLIGKHLCPKKEGKPTTRDVYSALFSQEAKAKKEFSTQVDLTSFMQSLVGSAVNNLGSKQARASKQV